MTTGDVVFDPHHGPLRTCDSCGETFDENQGHECLDPSGILYLVFGAEEGYVDEFIGVYSTLEKAKAMATCHHERVPCGPEWTKGRYTIVRIAVDEMPPIVTQRVSWDHNHWSIRYP